MRSSSLNVEHYIYENAQKINIDQDFKKNLKTKFISMEREEKYVAAKPTRTSYLRVASFVVAAVLTGGGAFTAGNLYAKTSMNNMASKQNAGKYSKTTDLTPSDSFGKNNAEIAQVINGKSTVDESDNIASAGQKTPAIINITPTQSNQNDNKGATNSLSNPATNIAANPTTSSTTDPVTNQGSSTQNNANTDNTANNIVANTDTPKPETTEIVLKMVSGRYMIQSIKVTAIESVKTLPEEYNNATIEESLKMPVANDEKTAFEKDGSIYMVRQTTKKVVLVDSGTAPQVYAPINILSYIKQEPSAETDKPSTSSVWVFDGNSAMKYNVLTNSDGKYTYINTFWSNSGKELYVLEENTQTKEYQILKITLEIE